MAIIRRENKYQVKVRDRFGQWLPSRTFATKTEAETYERHLHNRRDQGDFAGTMRAVTFGEFLELWKKECRGDVSQGWIKTQEQMLRDFILPTLASRKLHEIRPQDVGRLIEETRVKHSLAPNTLKHVYAILHKVFEDGVEHFGCLLQNPVLRRYRPRVPLRERNFLSPAESFRLMDFTREHYLGPAIWLQLLTGMRPSEVQALTWKCVDFERSQILIRAAYNNKVGCLQEHPKQDDWGTAPIPPPLATYLRLCLGKAGQQVGESSWVAPNKWGAMLPYETYLRALRRICREAGVLEVTPHELRHSCTEIYVQAGASAEDIRRLLNQSSLTATARYMHRTDERLNRLAFCLNVPEKFPKAQIGQQL